MVRETLYVDSALTLARCAADVANFCDHVEHNELTDRRWVVDAAASLRREAWRVAEHGGDDLRALYAARLRAIEQRTPTWTPEGLDSGALAERATSWRDLQVVQAEHDRHYHADVVGLSRLDQLRHCAHHVAKLAGATAAVAQGTLDAEDFRARRLPDLLLFGIKLATVMGERLSDARLDEGADGQSLVAR
jgi:hypothetical protein